MTPIANSKSFTLFADPFTPKLSSLKNHEGHLDSFLPLLKNSDKNRLAYKTVLFSFLESFRTTRFVFSSSPD